ncbi:MAG: Hsp20/alpha crystallin family protein [Flavobacteriales bacterium]|nr:MAG: Hsp20/alpha crystallin family protein [Flavobacteriales bacterium]|tara:strand:- start:1318 stop:1746 length:429 start_codon:yes stop_codon:yes gene_type:complete
MNLISTNLNRWKPTLLDELFDDRWFNFDTFNQTFPAVNTIEKDNQYLLEIAVPGMDKKDFEIEIQNDLISISSISKQEKEVKDNLNYNRQEFNYNSFHRTFSLPKEIDQSKIRAIYTNGILTITLPKLKEVISKSKKLIEVK